MNKYLIVLFIIVYWAISTIATVGAIHANNLAQFSFMRNNLRDCRADLGFAWGWGVLPFTTPIGFLLTGFWYDGFKWDCKDAR